jgi:hypothetical protein
LRTPASGDAPPLLAEDVIVLVSKRKMKTNTNDEFIWRNTNSITFVKSQTDHIQMSEHQSAHRKCFGVAARRHIAVVVQRMPLIVVAHDIALAQAPPGSARTRRL